MDIIKELNEVGELLEIEEKPEYNSKIKEDNELTKLKKEIKNYHDNYYNRCQKLIKEIKNKSKIIKVYNLSMHNGILKMDLNTQKQILPEIIPVEKEEGVKINSNIIRTIDDYNLINKKLEEIYKNKIEYKLLFRASADGAFGQIFKQKCSKSRKTLTIVESKKNRKFGGFTEAVWNDSDSSYEDNNTFCFSFDEKKIYTTKKFGSAIYCKKDSGPIFCNMFGINNEFITEGGYSKTFEIESEKYEGISKDYELAGEEEFEIKELEVFKIRLIL